MKHDQLSPNNACLCDRYSVTRMDSHRLSGCFLEHASSKKPGSRFNIKMISYPYMKSHCGDKTILRPSYLHNWISYIILIRRHVYIESGPVLQAELHTTQTCEYGRVEVAPAQRELVWCGCFGILAAGRCLVSSSLKWIGDDSESGGVEYSSGQRYCGLQDHLPGSSCHTMYHILL